MTYLTSHLDALGFLRICYNKCSKGTMMGCVKVGVELAQHDKHCEFEYFHKEVSPLVGVITLLS